MYDIIQQTPLYQSWTRKALEEGLEKGKAEGLLEGKLEGLRETLVNIVRVRFPRLASLARTQAAQINDPDVLGDLIIQVSTASKAQEVRRALLGEDESGKG
jgi:predicted transposase YdaD